MDFSAAMARSSQHNEIVSVEYAGSQSELLADLSEVYDGDIESVNIDGTIDVWGFDSSTDDGIMDWRLFVTLVVSSLKGI